MLNRHLHLVTLVSPLLLGEAVLSLYVPGGTLLEELFYQSFSDQPVREVQDTCVSCIGRDKHIFIITLNCQYFLTYQF